MIKSFLLYSKYISYSIFNSEVRKMIFSDFLRFNLGQKVISNITINPWTDKTYHEEERAQALDMASEWLLKSQNATADNGFGSYHLINKWSGSYVETTGYIIPSLLSYGINQGKSDIITQALKAAGWLIAIQKESGGWQGERMEDNRPEVVFNTGQVIRGLVSAFKYTNDDRYLKPAIKACDWLCAIQEKDGFWKKNAFMNVPRVYDSYVDLPLLMMYEITGNNAYRETAIKNLLWITENKQLSNGWFEDCDNTIKRNDKPVLHTISYTIDGLIDCGIILNDQKIISAGIKSADMLFGIFNKKKYLKGRFDDQWKGSEYMIPAGCAQIAIVWMKLFKLTGNIQYLNSSLKMNDILIFIQDRKIKETPDTKGAIPGSYPIWGKYEPFCFPNWATKFFVDSLLLENECLKGIKEQ